MRRRLAAASGVDGRHVLASHCGRLGSGSVASLAESARARRGGIVYLAFVVEVFPKRIMGWDVATYKRTDGC